MSPIAPRSVGLAVALSASLAAAAGLVVGALTRSADFRRRTRRASSRPAEFGIHRVPVRPPLWDAHPSTGPILTVADLRDVAPVPPENNHAPAGS